MFTNIFSALLSFRRRKKLNSSALKSPNSLSDFAYKSPKFAAFCFFCLKVSFYCIREYLPDMVSKCVSRKNINFIMRFSEGILVIFQIRLPPTRFDSLFELSLPRSSHQFNEKRHHCSDDINYYQVPCTEAFKSLFSNLPQIELV